MLHRLQPGRLHIPLGAIFRLLFLGQGFSSDTGRFARTVRNAWNGICTQVPIWQDLLFLGVFFSDPGDVSLDLTQNGGQLAVSGHTTGLLATYLGGLQVTSDSGGTLAGDVAWPKWGRAGLAGCLIVIVVSGSTAGELYQPFGTQDCPWPLVAVVETGAHWTNVPLRGVAQALAGLGDEYELATADADKPSPPSVDPWSPSPPNLIYLTDRQMDNLKAWAPTQNPKDADWPPANLVCARPHHWPMVNQTSPWQFRPHPETTANPPRPAPTGSVNFIEGGGGYRHNVLRGDYDCLMRRMPNSAQLPIQDDIGFCAVCRKTLTDVALANFEVDLSHVPRARMNTQRVEYDRYNWQTQSSSALPYTNPLTVSKAGPTWKCTVDVNAGVGLRLSAVKLGDRPDDPFSPAEDVFDRIEFSGLAVVYGDGSQVALSFADAFGNAIDPPTLETAQFSDPPGALAGIKLTLSWDLPGSWAVDAILSVVLKDMKNDFDPGGAAWACKLYPQIALRYRRPSPKAPPRPNALPRVAALKGTVHLAYNNVIPTTLAQQMDGAWQQKWASMCMGMLAATLATDSNSTDLPVDNDYSFAPAPIVPILPVGTRNSGRKLAGVEVASATSVKRGGAPFRVAHLYACQPVLPHWSWLFDYVYPDFAGTKQFVAVYAVGEANEPRGATERRVTVTWPPSLANSPNAPTMLVLKTPRQGAYDSIHVNAAMNPDSQNRPTIAAPFCADKCIHLHWRWGVVATSAATDKYAFLGWGNGRLDQGAGTWLGAPLVPPNQHVDLVCNVPPDRTSCDVQYRVTAYEPGDGEYQVILEQGAGVAFNYQGLGWVKVAGLAAGLNLVPPSPRANAEDVRMLFPKIYEAIRWYSADPDACTDHQVPGDPSLANPDLNSQLSALEDL
jgi:hypothetical protein